MTPNEIDPIDHLNRQRLIFEMLRQVLSNQLMGVSAADRDEFKRQRELDRECFDETERIIEEMDRLVKRCPKCGCIP